MRSGCWFCIAGSGAGLIKRPATFPKPAHRWRLRREPHSGHSHVAGFTASAGMRSHRVQSKGPRGFLLHRRMTRFPKCVKAKPVKTNLWHKAVKQSLPSQAGHPSPVCVWPGGISMAHDHNGRVGPPRCEECNAPLNSDERRLDAISARSLCLDCHLERYPFFRIKKGKRRRRMLARAGASKFAPFVSAIPNLEVEPLVRP
jgi:hypothetical protein